MSGTERVEVTILRLIQRAAWLSPSHVWFRKFSRVRLVIALDIVRIHWVSARRKITKMLVRIEMISMGVSEWMFLHHLGHAVL